MSGEPNGAYIELATLLNLRHSAKYLQLHRQQHSKALLSGSHRSRYLSRGMEFEEVRQYQPGDDVRSIDWRVTARTQLTHTKQYQEEKEKPVITFVDQRPSMFFGSKPCFKSVYACHLAALINWAALAQGDRTGGLVAGIDTYADIRPARSHKTLNRWLQQLVDFNHQLTPSAISTPALSLRQSLEPLQRIAKPGSTVFIISDFNGLDKSAEEILFKLSRHCQVRLLWVIDQLEIRLPPAATLAISNGTKRTVINTQEQICEAYYQSYQHMHERLKQLADRLAITLIMAQLQQSPTELLNEIFSRHRSSHHPAHTLRGQ